MHNLAFWMTQPPLPHIEIADDPGFCRVMLDIEHGTFGLDAMDRVIPFCRALGMTVYARARQDFATLRDQLATEGMI
ncbi:MAG: hypothetical protein MUF11_03160 [Beijerinckiaceae bacterium]|jgi:4-hydroxy-2-oxoheptanedioate aldolase|nr:hypothetical protein [Beijerinckiaceae bacterium]